MARAKRTDRAEARRRNRAISGLDPLESDDAAEPAATASARPAKAGGPAPVARASLGSAFKNAFHPVDLRSDLRTFPTLLRSRALWLPILAVVATAAAVVLVGRVNIAVNLATTYFVEAPAIGAVFLAGFLAPRSSWLLGLIVGLVAAAAFIGLLYGAPANLYPVSIYERVPDAVTSQQFAISSLIFSPVMGSLFAAAAAWYRRFLQLSNPNRGRRAAPPAKRAGNGRSRAAGARR